MTLPFPTSFRSGTITHFILDYTVWFFLYNEDNMMTHMYRIWLKDTNIHKWIAVACSYAKHIVGYTLKHRWYRSMFFYTEDTIQSCMLSAYFCHVNWHNFLSNRTIFYLNLQRSALNKLFFSTVERLHCGEAINIWITTKAFEMHALWGKKTAFWTSAGCLH